MTVAEIRTRGIEWVREADASTTFPNAPYIYKPYNKVISYGGPRLQKKIKMASHLNIIVLQLFLPPNISLNLKVYTGVTH